MQDGGDGRSVAASPVPFVHGATVAAKPITHIEGKRARGEIALKALIAGEDLLCMQVHRRKGLVDAAHAHDDHESICYLVSGRMRVVIGDEEFIAGPGDVWLHRRGVTHYHETLEDSVQLEFKSPPRRTWD